MDNIAIYPTWGGERLKEIEPEKDVFDNDYFKLQSERRLQQLSNTKNCPTLVADEVDEIEFELNAEEKLSILESLKSYQKKTGEEIKEEEIMKFERHCKEVNEFDKFDTNYMHVKASAFRLLAFKLGFELKPDNFNVYFLQNKVREQAEEIKRLESIVEKLKKGLNYNEEFE